jgi:hypothetical protein
MPYESRKIDSVREPSIKPHTTQMFDPYKYDEMSLEELDAEREQNRAKFLQMQKDVEEREEARKKVLEAREADLEKDAVIDARTASYGRILYKDRILHNLPLYVENHRSTDFHLLSVYMHMLAADFPEQSETLKTVYGRIGAYVRDRSDIEDDESVSAYEHKKLVKLFSQDLIPMLADIEDIEFLRSFAPFFTLAII